MRKYKFVIKTNNGYIKTTDGLNVHLESLGKCYSNVPIPVNGKVYMEYTIKSIIGLFQAIIGLVCVVGGKEYYICYYASGGTGYYEVIEVVNEVQVKRYNSSAVANLNYKVGDVIGTAFNLKENYIDMYLNAVFQYRIVPTILDTKNKDDIFVFLGNGASSNYYKSDIVANFGAKPFTYPIPVGYQPVEKPLRKRLYIKDNAIFGKQTTP